MVASRSDCYDPDMYIKITSTPQGEAPEWVREAWVGVKLPTCRSGPIRWWTSGTVTGPTGNYWIRELGSLFLFVLFPFLFWWLPRIQGYKKLDGYIVNVSDALAILEQNHADAAEWYRTSPAVKSHREFMFECTCCRPSSS